MRYFYSCPLEAAYMAKVHGMRFTDAPSSCELFYEADKAPPFNWMPSTNPGCGYTGDRFYVYHPSESLLNVRRGDLIKTQAVTAMGEEDFNEFIYWVAENPCNIEDVIAIVQRNGKPWFTPEREEVV